MPDSGFTEASIIALEQAIAEGVQRVRYQDREVVYRDMKEMREALAMMKQAVRKSKGNGGLFGGTRITGRHSKGLD
jgi:hypothetical protein